MESDKQKIKYFLYARKSSESEDRQVQSIDDQVNRLKKLANERNLDIKRIFTEAKSAKKPSNRPVFDDVVQRIENMEADGILCWQINRLSRNPIDSARIQWLLQQGILKSILTIDRQYLPEDNVLLFNVESGMANQFILDLSKNVRRGIQSKLEKGWRPGMAPVGYLNELAEHTLIKDPERFPLIRRCWDLMLTGDYTVPQILEKLNNEWGFRTVKKRRCGGIPLDLSMLYRIFTNPFYYGTIVHKGQEYEGKHEPMITIEEYDRVQFLLGRNGRPRLRKHKFAFTGVIKCGECDYFVTAEEKTKLVKSTGEIHKHRYYHCTHKRRDTKCSQRGGVREADLELQIEKELEKYTILPEFRDWALEILNEKNNQEIEDRSKIYETQYKTLVQIQKELDSLTKMRYRDLIDDDTFIRERNLLQKQITQLKSKLRQTEGRAEKWLELTEKTFNFATYARKAFIMGGLETKKEILSALGSNFTLKDGKLSIEANEWLKPIAEQYPALEAEYRRLELTKFGSTKAKDEAFASLYAKWQGRRESNPRRKFWRLP